MSSAEEASAQAMPERRFSALTAIALAQLWAGLDGFWVGNRLYKALDEEDSEVNTRREMAPSPSPSPEHNRLSPSEHHPYVHEQRRALVPIMAPTPIRSNQQLEPRTPQSTNEIIELERQLLDINEAILAAEEEQQVIQQRKADMKREEATIIQRLTALRDPNLVIARNAPIKLEPDSPPVRRLLNKSGTSFSHLVGPQFPIDSTRLQHYLFVPSSGQGGRWISLGKMPSAFRSEMFRQVLARILPSQRQRDIWSGYARNPNAEAEKGRCVGFMLSNNSEGTKMSWKGTCGNQKRACDNCVKKWRPCIRFMRPKQLKGTVVAWFSLPEELRVGKDVDDIGFWVRPIPPGNRA